VKTFLAKEGGPLAVKGLVICLIQMAVFYRKNIFPNGLAPIPNPSLS